MEKSNEKMRGIMVIVGGYRVYQNVKERKGADKCGSGQSPHSQGSVKGSQSIPFDHIGP